MSVKAKKPSVSGKKEFFCKVCRVACVSEASFQAHQYEERHRMMEETVNDSGSLEMFRNLEDYIACPKRNEPLIGLQYIVQLHSNVKNKNAFQCTLCKQSGTLYSVMMHLKCYRHRQAYICRKYPKMMPLFTKRTPSFEKALIYREQAKEIEHKEGASQMKVSPKHGYKRAFKDDFLKYSIKRQQKFDAINKKLLSLVDQKETVLKYLEAFTVSSLEEVSLVQNLTEDLEAAMNVFYLNTKKRKGKKTFFPEKDRELEYRKRKDSGIQVNRKRKSPWTDEKHDEAPCVSCSVDVEESSVVESSVPMEDCEKREKARTPAEILSSFTLFSQGNSVNRKRKSPWRDEKHDEAPCVSCSDDVEESSLVENSVPMEDCEKREKARTPAEILSSFTLFSQGNSEFKSATKKSVWTKEPVPSTSSSIFPDETKETTSCNTEAETIEAANQTPAKAKQVSADKAPKRSWVLRSNSSGFGSNKWTSLFANNSSDQTPSTSFSWGAKSPSLFASSKDAEEKTKTRRTSTDLLSTFTLFSQASYGQSSPSINFSHKSIKPSSGNSPSSSLGTVSSHSFQSLSFIDNSSNKLSEGKECHEDNSNDIEEKKAAGSSCNDSSSLDETNMFKTVTPVNETPNNVQTQDTTVYPDHRVHADQQDTHVEKTPDLDLDRQDIQHADLKNNPLQNPKTDDENPVEQDKSMEQANANTSFDHSGMKNSQPLPSVQGRASSAGTLPSNNTRTETGKPLTADILQLFKGKDVGTVTNMLKSLSTHYPALKQVNLEVFARVLRETGALD